MDTLAQMIHLAQNPAALEACKAFRVKSLHVFGSFASGKMDASSDIDLLVEFDRDGYTGALEREFEIIGEALVRLERLDEVKLSQRIHEYRKIIGFRNLVAHGYDTIDDAALWDLSINHVPELQAKVLDY